MTKGNYSPVPAAPLDRFALQRLAQERHTNAVQDYERASAIYWEEVNARPLPELMQGPVVRVTDLTSIEQAFAVLSLAEDPRTDHLTDELAAYRAERDRLADWHGIADLAELVAITAAAVVRAGRSGHGA
ncbi:MAG TPA: hypothetical protein VGQ28_17365 [Thermoanaerobaculia bacterium]|jgi:hypothetical protein|nr:hypothetical protein [Thermoanaerobaculia bacterium]